MRKLTYEDYCNFYAQRCKICKSAKRVQKNNVWTSCICQHTATSKWHLEEFDVYPPELKYKTWSDFTGVSNRGDDVLMAESLCEAKSKIFAYCFGKYDQSYLEDRKKHLTVHKHRADGQNVVIVGDNRTGKTMLSVLIIKEIVHACQIHNLDLKFQIINANVIRDLASWDPSKPIDHDSLEALEAIDYLVVDDLDIFESGGYRFPDIGRLNIFFRRRTISACPTVFLCSPAFWNQLRIVNSGRIRQLWGDDIVDSLTRKDNTLILLNKTLEDQLDDLA